MKKLLISFFVIFAGCDLSGYPHQFKVGQTVHIKGNTDVFVIEYTCFDDATVGIVDKFGKTHYLAEHVLVSTNNTKAE
jgi:hypothetical protein